MERLTPPSSACRLADPSMLFRVGFLFVFFSFLGIRLSHADSSQDLFKQANAAYAKGDFPQAITLYQSAQTGGLKHWILFYNLGNAFYKNNQLGKAIVNYQRAFRLNSHAADLIYNLSFASNKAGDPLIPGTGLVALCWQAYFLPSLNVLALLLSVLWIPLCARIVLALLGKKALSAEFAGIFLVGVLSSGLWLGTRIYFAEKSEGIIVGPSADVRSGPSLSDPANFTIPEGRRVLLLDEQEPVTGWIEIGVPQEGVKGWIPTTVIEKI